MIGHTFRNPPLSRSCIRLSSLSQKRQGEAISRLPHVLDVKLGLAGFLPTTMCTRTSGI